MDLDRVWGGVTAELSAPRPALLERLAARAGIDPSLARFAAVTPSLGWAWLLASVAVIGLGMSLQGAAGVDAGVPALVVAPLVAAAVVAFAYGPAVDPAYEIVAVTPLSPVRGLLARLALVLTVNALLVALFDLLVRRDGVHAGWLLPMAAVAMLAAVVAARSLPVVGAVTGAGVWVLVLTVGHARKVPVAALSSLPAQVGFALVAVVLGWLLVRAARRGGFAGGLPAG